MAKCVYVGAPNFEPVTLPSGYTQLEYIQSSGTQCINTGLKPSQNTRIKMSANIIADGSSSSWYALYGARTAVRNADMSFWLNGALGTQIDFGNVSDTSITATSANLEVDQNKNVATLNGKSVTLTANTFTAAYDLYLFCVNTAGSLSYYTPMQLKSCQIYDKGTLVRNFVPAKNSSGTIGLYDLVNGVFYTNAGSGTFTAGATYAAVARKIKKIYLGIDNVAHKIKKGYIGDANGIARLFFALAGKISYYGEVTALRAYADSLAGASNGNYAIFGGGVTSGGGSSSVVTAYNKSLTRSAPTALSTARSALAAASIGGYVIFAGGYADGSASNVVDTYNGSLTKGIATALSAARYNLAAANSGNNALFGGGRTGESSISNVVDAYNSSLTRSVPTALSFKSTSPGAACIGNNIIFAGGDNFGYQSAANAYDASLTRSTPAALSVARDKIAATAIGDNALFAGGQRSTTANPNATTAVDTYSKSLTKSTADPLSVARSTMAATTIIDFALFAGGTNYNNAAGRVNTVDAYDESLIHTIPAALPAARLSNAAAAIGNYALIAGGDDSSLNLTNNVYAYLCS